MLNYGWFFPHYSPPPFSISPPTRAAILLSSVCDGYTRTCDARVRVSTATAQAQIRNWVTSYRSSRTFHRNVLLSENVLELVFRTFPWNVPAVQWNGQSMPAGILYRSNLNVPNVPTFETLPKVNIRRGIFQGDSLSPLLFVLALFPLSMILRKVSAGYEMTKDGCRINHLLFMDDLKLFAKNEKEIDSLVQTVRIFSDDTGVKFGLEKCAAMTMKRGKRVHSDGTALPDGTQLRALGEEESYKYIGVLEADHVLHDESKERLKKECIRRVKKCLKSMLNGGNMVKAINTWAVSLMRCSAGIVEWIKADLDVTDRKTRKLMTMYGMLHPRSNVSRLYLPRSEGGRGLLSVSYSVNIERRSLQCHVSSIQEKLLKVAQKYIKADELGPKEYNNQRREERTRD